MSATLVQLFKEAAEKHCQETAVQYDDGENIETITYSQLQATAAMISNYLRKFKCANEVIGLAVKPSVILPACLIGIMDAPAAFYSLDVEVPREMINYMVRTLSIRRFLVETIWAQELCKKLDSYSIVYIEVEDLPKLSMVQLDTCSCQKLASPLAYVITTSGTTGRPKVVRVPHQCIVPNITHLRDILNIIPTDTVYQAAPLTFDTSIVGIFVTLSRGATLLVIPQVLNLIPSRLADILGKRNRVTVLQATPTLVSSLGPHLKSSLLSKETSLRVVAFGGEKCPSTNQLSEWRAEGNATTFYNLYGITEVSCWASCHEVTEEEISKGIEVPLGQPLLHTSLQIRDRDGNEATEGYLFIGSSTRVCQTDDEPEVNDTCTMTFRPAGDWVRSDGKGHIYYLGRTDDQTKRNGKRMNLLELETVAMKSPMVDQAVAMCDKAGTLSLFLQCSPGKATPQLPEDEDSKCMKSNLNAMTVIEDNVKKMIKDHLPAHYHPDQVIIVPLLPMTKHGKVDKKKLLEGNRQAGHSVSQQSLEEEDIEQRVEENWKMCSGTEVVLDMDNFIQCGGDSFKAVHLLNQLERTFKTLFPILLDHILAKRFIDVVQYVLKVIKGQAETEQLENRDSSAPSKNFKKGSTAFKVHEVCPRKRKLEENEHYSSLPKDASTVSMLGQSTQKVMTHQSMCTCGQVTESVVYSIQRGSNVTQYDRQLGSHCCENKARRSQTERGDSFSLDDHQILGNSEQTPSVDTDCKPSRPEEQNFVEAQVHDTLPLSKVAKTAKVYGESEDLKLVKKWVYPTGKCVDASPLVVAKKEGAVVYIGSHSHKFSAISMSTGYSLWEVTLGDRVESSACLSRCARYVIVGCYDGYVYTLDAQSGQVKWQYQTGGQVKSSPCVDPVSGLVYIGSHDQHLHALDVQAEVLAWKCSPGGGSVFASPCVSVQPHLVYAATLAGKVSALCAKTGNSVWHTDVQQPVFSSPSVLGCGVCVGSVSGVLHCFSHQGSKLWDFKTEGPIFSSICVWPAQNSLDDRPGAAANQHVIFGSHDKHVYCLTANSGELVWKLAMDTAVYATPFTFPYPSTSTNSNQLQEPSSQDLAVICSISGTCKILDLKSGTVRSTFTFPDRTFSSPVTFRNHLVIGCRDENVYCLDLQ